MLSRKKRQTLTERLAPLMQHLHTAGRDDGSPQGTKGTRTAATLEKRVFASDRSRHSLSNLTWQDMCVLEAVNAALRPVADFTDILSTENDVTVSSIVPMLHHLRDSALKVEACDAKMTILAQLDIKYDNKIACACCRLQLCLTLATKEPRDTLRPHCLLLSVHTCLSTHT